MTEPEVGQKYVDTSKQHFGYVALVTRLTPHMVELTFVSGGKNNRRNRARFKREAFGVVFKPLKEEKP